VSVVRFRLWPPLPIFETHEFSGITGGLSATAAGENRPTSGLPHIGSVVPVGRRGRQPGELKTWNPGNPRGAA
jgi:hypothetical protein